MKNFLRRLMAFEPVQMRALLVALVVAAGAFGLELSPYADRIDVAWTALFAVIPILQGLFTRPAVTPNAKVESRVGVPSKRH